MRRSLSINDKPQLMHDRQFERIDWFPAWVTCDLCGHRWLKPVRESDLNGCIICPNCRNKSEFNKILPFDGEESR